VSVTYAPPSMITSMAMASKVPSFLQPDLMVTTAGWRLVVASMSSLRP